MPHVVRNAVVNVDEGALVTLGPNVGDGERNGRVGILGTLRWKEWKKICLKMRISFLDREFRFLIASHRMYQSLCQSVGKS